MYACAGAGRCSCAGVSRLNYFEAGRLNCGPGNSRRSGAGAGVCERCKNVMA